MQQKISKNLCLTIRLGVGDTVLNNGRTETIISVSNNGKVKRYYTRTLRGGVNMFTSASFCELSQKEKTIAFVR